MASRKWVRLAAIGLAAWVAAAGFHAQATDEPFGHWALVLEEHFTEDDGRWALEPSEGSQTFVDGQLVLDGEGLATSVTSVPGMVEKAVEAEIRLGGTAQTAMALIRTGAMSRSGFAVSISSDGKVGIQTVTADQSLELLEEIDTALSPVENIVRLRLEWVGESLTCFAWNTGLPRPESPTLAANAGLEPQVDGEVGFGVVNGTLRCSAVDVFARVLTPDEPLWVAKFDEDDPSAGDGWVPLLAEGGRQRIEDGDLVLEGPGVNASVFTRVDGLDISLLTHVAFDGAAAALVTVRGRVNPYGGYVASLSLDGTVQLILAKPNSEARLLAEADSGLDPNETEVFLYLKVAGQALEAFVWPVGMRMPSRPIVSAVDEQGQFTTGLVALNVLDGRAKFRFAEIARVMVPAVITKVRVLRPELRYRLTWQSAPGQLYEFQYSHDQETWIPSGFFAPGTEDSESTSAILPASIFPDRFGFVLVRVLAQPGNEPVAILFQEPLRPPLSPVEITWDSVPGRAYALEFSPDLRAWQAYEFFLVAGLDDFTTVVIPGSPERSPVPGVKKRYYRIAPLLEVPVP